MSTFLWSLANLILQGATVVPEFVVTTGGELRSQKSSVTGSANQKGAYIVSWLDSRDGGSPMSWTQAYLQYVPASGLPQKPNSHLNTSLSFLYPVISSSVVLFDDAMALTSTTCQRRGIQNDSIGIIVENAILRLWNAEQGFDGSPLAEFVLPLKAPLLCHYSTDLCLGIQNQASSSSDTNRMLFQRFQRSGQLIADTVFIDNGTVTSVTINDAGDFAVAYKSYPSGAFCFRRYTADNSALGEAVVFDPKTTSLALAGDPKGTLLCAWVEYGEDYNYYIYTRRYTSANTPLGSKQLIFESGNMNPGKLTLVKAQQGGYLLCYNLFDTYMLDFSDSLYGVLLDSYGVIKGGAFTINQAEGSTSGIFEFWTTASKDGYTAAWIEDNVVFTRPISSSGILGAELTVSDDQLGYHAQWNESVLEPQSGFFVHWKEGLSHFDAQGLPTIPIWKMDTLKCTYPSLGLDSNFYLSFLVQNRDSVYVQRFTKEGAPEVPARGMGSLGGKKCRQTAVAAGKDSEGVVFWSQAVNTYNVRLYGQRFGADGSKTGVAFLVDSFYNRGNLRAFMFEDGSFVAGVAQASSGAYWLHFYKASGEKEMDVYATDWSTYQSGTTMISNSKDRIVVAGMNLLSDTLFFKVFDRQFNQIGGRQFIATSHLFHAEPYFLAAAMSPSGRFVIAWMELDDAGNMNLWGELFSRDGEPITAPFRVNDADQWPYSFQFSGPRGVSCTDDRILFTWLENRTHRGWDVVAKVTDWNLTGITSPPVTPATHQLPSEVEITSPIGPTVTLHYSNCPNGFRGRVFDASGRQVDEIQSPQSEGTIQWGKCYGSGVYFIFAEGSKANPARVVLIK